jgi:hypothetical protein
MKFLTTITIEEEIPEDSILIAATLAQYKGNTQQLLNKLKERVINELSNSILSGEEVVNCTVKVIE